LALDRLHDDYPEFSYELVGWSEIDSQAIKAHNAIYPQWADRNYGDIAKIDWLQVPNFDLFTYSFPCQSVSTCGLQHGLTEGSGTRSSLLWECKKAIVTKNPKYLLMENVKALLQKKFMPDFQKWIGWLESQGYKNVYQVMNAKDYGVPQNRERVFMVSILTEQPMTFRFPNPFKLTKRVIDILEPDVADRYYFKQEQIERILKHCERKVSEGCGFRPQFTPPRSVSGTISTKYGTRETDPLLTLQES
jgi:DNA (cytosine-5)-methyltransferase 1